MAVVKPGAVVKLAAVVKCDGGPMRGNVKLAAVIKLAAVVKLAAAVKLAAVVKRVVTGCWQILHVYSGPGRPGQVRMTSGCGGHGGRHGGGHGGGHRRCHVVASAPGAMGTFSGPGRASTGGLRIGAAVTGAVTAPAPAEPSRGGAVLPKLTAPAVTAPPEAEAVQLTRQWSNLRRAGVVKLTREWSNLQRAPYLQRPLNQNLRQTRPSAGGSGGGTCPQIVNTNTCLNMNVLAKTPPPRLRRRRRKGCLWCVCV